MAPNQLWSIQIQHEVGKLRIQNIKDSDVDGASVLMSRSFAGKEWRSFADVKCVHLWNGQRDLVDGQRCEE